VLAMRVKTAMNKINVAVPRRVASAFKRDEAPIAKLKVEGRALHIETSI
jgi:hypothetical protein